MTLEEFQTYLKRPATMEEAGEIVDILGSTILSAVKMLPNTEENKEEKGIRKPFYLFEQRSP